MDFDDSRHKVSRFRPDARPKDINLALVLFVSGAVNHICPHFPHGWLTVKLKNKELFPAHPNQSTEHDGKTIRVACLATIFLKSRPL